MAAADKADEAPVLEAHHMEAGPVGPAHGRMGVAAPGIEKADRALFREPGPGFAS